MSEHSELSNAVLVEIRYLLKRGGITYKALSKELLLSPSTTSKIVNGSVELKVDRLYLIALKLKTTVGAIVASAENRLLHNNLDDEISSNPIEESEYQGNRLRFLESVK